MMASEQVSTESSANNTDKNSEKSSKISGGIIVSARQRGNPILKSIRLVPWEFSDTIIPDYIIGEDFTEKIILQFLDF